MKFKYSYLLALAMSLTFLVSCDPDTPEDDEAELITTLNYTLTSVDGDVVVLSFVDLDGDGGNNPVIASLPLQANTTYTGSIELLNESEDPAEDITEEVQEEDEEHQFFFTSATEGVSIAYADMDADGNPVGLSSTVTTGDAATGTITVTLIHEPAKDADGVSSGDISNAEGETDIEVTFPIVVE